MSTNTPAREREIKELVDRFLTWPLPAGVCTDLCTTMPNYPYPRTGTSLLTALEAEEMLLHVLGPYFAKSDERVKELEERADEMYVALDRAQDRNTELMDHVLKNTRSCLQDLAEYKALQAKVASLRSALEKIKDGGVDFGVLANVEERMMAMCDIATQALSAAEKDGE